MHCRGAAGRAFKNSGNHEVQEFSGKHPELGSEEDDTFTSSMRVTGPLRTLYQVMKKEGREMMEVFQNGLEWQEKISAAAVQIFEDRKENLTEQDILRQERYLPPVISFDEICAISAPPRSVRDQPATTGQVPLPCDQPATTGLIPARRGRPTADLDPRRGAKRGRKAGGGAARLVL